MDCASDGVICTKPMVRPTKMSFSFTVCSYQVVLADAAQSQGMLLDGLPFQGQGWRLGEYPSEKKSDRGA
jgi:hypothetical protein